MQGHCHRPLCATSAQTLSNRFIVMVTADAIEFEAAPQPAPGPVLPGWDGHSPCCCCATFQALKLATQCGPHSMTVSVKVFGATAKIYLFLRRKSGITTCRKHHLYLD